MAMATESSLIYSRPDYYDLLPTQLRRDMERFSIANDPDLNRAIQIHESYQGPLSRSSEHGLSVYGLSHYDVMESCNPPRPSPAQLPRAIQARPMPRALTHTMSDPLPQRDSHVPYDRSISDVPNNSPVSNDQGLLSPAGSLQQQISNASRYKTELCRPHQENGYCKYGDKCQFAHGVTELRTMSRHPKYKTEKCRTYWSKALCPYGARCNFIHTESKDTRQQPQMQSGAFMSDDLQKLEIGIFDVNKVNEVLGQMNKSLNSIGSSNTTSPAQSLFDSAASSPTYRGGTSTASVEEFMAQCQYHNTPRSSFPFPASATPKATDNTEQDIVDALAAQLDQQSLESRTATNQPMYSARSGGRSIQGQSLFSSSSSDSSAMF